MPPRVFYGSFDPTLIVSEHQEKAGGYRVSRVPPDATVRPSVMFEKLAEVTAMVQRKRAEILWFPKLPPGTP